MSQKKVAVIGSGPAGLTAAIYAARGQLNVTVYLGEQPGGQLTTTTVIENFPGFPTGIDGNELMANMQAQAKNFGAILKAEKVIATDFSQRPFIVTTEKGSDTFDGIIIASGASARWLGLPGEEAWIGRGYSSCATCDGFFYKGKKVIVVGGGDSAMEEANHLTHFADKVYLVHRKDSFRASQIMQDRVKKNPKIEIIWNSIVTAFHGDGKVEAVTLTDTVNGSEKNFPIDGVFVAIGHIPNTKFLSGQINLNAEGYIVPTKGTETNIAGVFTAGDVNDLRYRQAITAAGEGCKAAMDLEKYLRLQPENY